MKDQIQENVVILYKEYCDYIDSNAKDYREHDTYKRLKDSLSSFMEWLDKRFLKELV
jgi:regulator of sigma D